MTLSGLRESEINLAVEDNRVLHCPNCSKMYRMADDRGVAETIPIVCKRCLCPMDMESALKWMDNNAQAEHDPSLAHLGKRTREGITGLAPQPQEVQTKVRP